jgi:hypothetical protein
LPRKEYQNPPLTFEVREGWGWLLLPRKKIPEPPLAFEVREGVVVAIVTQKECQNPPPRVWSEGGDGGCRHCPEKNTDPLHSRLKRGRGGGSHCHPEKNARTPPPLVFGARERMLWSLTPFVGVVVPLLSMLLLSFHPLPTP